MVDGQPVWGLYNRPFTGVNLTQSRFTGLLGRTPGLRRIRLKEWQHFAFVHPDCYLSLAVVDVKYITTSFVCFFDRKSRQVLQMERKKGPGHTTLPDQLWDARFAFQSKDYRVTVHNNLSRQCHDIAVDAVASGGVPLKARFTVHQPLEQIVPLVAVLPLPNGRPFYTHKSPCPIEGQLTVGERTFAFEPGRDLGLMDVHKAFYPYRTFWHWATFAARDASDRIIALNLTHNVIENDHQYNENAMWVGDRLDRLGPARFTIPADATGPWQMRTLDGRVSLDFLPEGMRSETVNLLAAHSSYEQPFGRYSGTLTDEAGDQIEIRDVFGIAERHTVRW